MNKPDPKKRNVVEDPRSGEEYRPGELIVWSEHVARLKDQARHAGLECRADDQVVVDYSKFAALPGVSAPRTRVKVFVTGDDEEVDAFVRRIARDEGIDAHLDTVFTADPLCYVDCPPDAAFANPAYANPAYANPAYANPAYANPAYANSSWPWRHSHLPPHPADVHGFDGRPYAGNGHRRRENTARPTDQPVKRATSEHCDAGSDELTVVILDTGVNQTVARQAYPDATWAKPFAGFDMADVADAPDCDGDKELDPVAGHGTFIAGLIESAMPRVRMVLPRVVKENGEVEIADIPSSLAKALSPLLDAPAGLDRDAKALYGFRRLARAVVGMSFSGRMTGPNMTTLLEAIDFFGSLGVVFVASAGNDRSCEPMFPAALGDPTATDPRDHVVSVGALSRNGPARFTNYGPWIRACAAGHELTSCFFIHDEKKGECRSFDGWAVWSGTSFAVPVVIAALLKEMHVTGSTANAAVARLIDAPGRPAVHNLGTIVT